MSEQRGFGRPSDDPDSPDFTGPGGFGDVPAGTSAARPRPWPELPPRDPASQSTPVRPSSVRPSSVRHPDDLPGPQHPGPERLVIDGRRSHRPGARPRRRRSRAPLVLFVVLLVVAGLLVAGDRLGVRYAEHRVAASLQARLGTAEPPTVEITGVPFLTQLGRRDFPLVRVRLGEVPATDTQVGLAAVDLTLHDARPDASFGTLAVDRLDGTARLDYAVLAGKLGHTVRYAGLDAAGRGRIGFDLTTTVFGESIKATVTGRPAVGATDGSVQLLDPAITVSGLAIPSGLAARLVDGILEPVELDQLPLGIRLTSLDATADGLVAGLSARQVNLPLR